MIATKQDIGHMRESGRLAAQLLAYLGSLVTPGVSTHDLDMAAAEWTHNAGAVSAPFGYTGRDHGPFPGHICTSVNEVVCHGIPSAHTILKAGDIINIDVTPILNGYHGDTSKTFAVGEISKESSDLIAATEECLMTGISLAQPGEYMGTIGYEISKKAMSLGFSIIKEFVGHGIGKKFHTEPYVTHFGVKNTGIKLIPGMIFTIEPILCSGDPTIYMRNEWEAVLKSSKYTAQAEHTILITPTGPEILTNEPSITYSQNSKAAIESK